MEKINEEKEKLTGRDAGYNPSTAEGKKEKIISKL